MDYIITEVFLDIANKYRVRAIIDNDTKETYFFRFTNYPTQEEVNIAVDNYLSLSRNISTTPTPAAE